MIIAWTLFIIFALIALVALLAAAYMYYASYTDSVAKYGDAALFYTVITIIFVVATAIAAQYLWGGGFH